MEQFSNNWHDNTSQVQGYSAITVTGSKKTLNCVSHNISVRMLMHSKLYFYLLIIYVHIFAVYILHSKMWCSTSNTFLDTVVNVQ